MTPQVAGRVYAADKRAAELCRELQIVGIAYDRERATMLAEALRAAEADARLRAEAAVGRALKSTKTGGFGTADLQAAFFKDLRAPVMFRSELTSAPSLGVDALRAYAACHDERLRALALALLEWRRARKIRSTYIDGVHVAADGRVHPSWLNYGAISGRWACQAPNLMNLPRRENDPTWAVVEGGIRSLYRARSGCALVIWDAKQLEMRVAAYASGDDAMISACESSDLHASNAAIIFGEAFTGAPPETRKALRSLAKQAGFAVCYMAEAATVYARIVSTKEGQGVTMRQVEAMLRRMRRAFRGYYVWQDRRLLECVRTGETDTPILGRVRRLGHDPSPTECANFPIQGGAADLMNARLPAVVDGVRELGARLVAQVHDSAVFEVPERHASSVVARSHEIFEAPIEIASSGRTLRPSFPLDSETAERWH